MNTNELAPEELEMRIRILELVVSRLFAAHATGVKLSPTELQEAMHAHILHITQRPRQVPPHIPLESWNEEVLRTEVRYTKWTDQLFSMVQDAIQSL